MKPLPSDCGWRRLLRAAFALVLVILVLPSSTALAYHDGLHLEVTPEVGSFTLGEPAVLTAVIVADEGFPFPAPADTRIDFENENGANDWDGTSRNSPDYSCVIPVDATSCQIEIDATRTGAALFRAWFGTADPDEARFSGFEDCRQQSDAPSSCQTNETNGVPNAGSTCGINTSVSSQLPGEEPDCTDVVQVVFLESAPGTLDCDDSTGPDTERESNPSGQADPATGADNNPSNELYTCYVRDEFGNLKPGAPVFGEIIEGVNDPDNGGVYTSADVGCANNQPGQPNQTREDDPLTPANEKGSCKIIVRQARGQIGTALICFWIGTLSEGAELCPSEEVGAGTNHEGADAQGDNRVDLVELTWENISDLVLDCSPETGFSLVNNTGSIECTALSTISDSAVQGIQIRAEAIGANDPDDSDSPQTQDSQPDAQSQNLNPLSCTTGPTGRCLIKHRGEDAGETIYRAWLDDNVAEPTGTNGVDQDVDQTEGQNERLVPGTTGEPDGTDVVITDWGKGPTSIVATPKSASAPTDKCHEITVTALDEEGNPTGGVRVDVEQQHERFRNATPSDEPIVGFCTPVAGPNPSDVDTSMGDLQPSGGGPNTSGTAGGETTQFTDTNGQVTIGVSSEPAQGSDGSGTAYVTTWWETIDNDDPGGGEPGDSALITWAVPSNSATLELSPDTGAADPGDEVTYTATVIHGAPIQGVEIHWSASGTGMFTWTDATTNSSGQAVATVSASEKGSMIVTATCGGSYSCSDTSTQNWGPALCDVIGTDGADVLTGTDASETICGFAGDDVIHGGGGDDVLIGGPGNDQLFGDAGLDQLLGGSGDDRLSGGSEDDELIAGRGNDTASGGSGNDYLGGDAGRDRMFGNSGSDSIHGGPGPDVLVGGPGKDSLEGEAGRDRCYQNSKEDKSTNC